MLTVAMLFLAIMLNHDTTGPEMNPGPTSVVAILFTIFACVACPVMFGISIMNKLRLALLKRQQRQLEETISAFHPNKAPLGRQASNLPSPTEIPGPLIALIQRHWLLGQEIRRLESDRSEI